MSLFKYFSEFSKSSLIGIFLENSEKYLNKDKEYYIVCQSGGRSTTACNKLINKGYDVVNVAGGVGTYMGTKRD